MTKIKEHYDLFVCTSGFEDRTIAGLKEISNRVTFNTVLINNYDVEDKKLKNMNEHNLGILKNILSDMDVKSIQVISSKPNSDEKWITNIKNYSKNVRSILVDITSFTRLFLYSTLYEIQLENVFTQYMYSEPEEYTHNISRGLEDIQIVKQYSGIPDQGKKILLILFLGWESKRAQSVIDEFMPDKVISILETSNDIKRDIWNRITEKSSKNIIQNSELCKIESLNPQKTFEKLEEIYEKHGNEYDFCIASVGPKPHCLAISKFAFNHKEIQVLYPVPTHWTKDMEENTSKPISAKYGKTYVFD